MNIISRAEAMAAGLKRYRPAKTCKYGHDCERMVSNGACLMCLDRQRSAYHEAHPDRVKARRDVYWAENAERISARRSARYASNPEHFKAIAAEYYAANTEKCRARSSAWQKANPEKVVARNAAHYAANPEFHRKRSAVWYAANTERGRESCRNWRTSNPEKMKASHKAWQDANPEKVRLLLRNRRARLRNAEGSHTSADIKEIYSMQKGRCAICRKKLDQKFHVDHIQPLARGGSNARSNLQIACGSCNVRKQAQDPITFMQSLGRLL